MHGKIYGSITELIGNTPLVKLNRIVPAGAAEVDVKLESFNPLSSVKDRIAISMVEEAEKAGELKPGSTIVEATSGNTGIGIAFVAAAKGYKCILVIPDTMSVERRKLLEAPGATLVLTPGTAGLPEAETGARSRRRRRIHGCRSSSATRQSEDSPRNYRSGDSARHRREFDVTSPVSAPAGTITGRPSSRKRSRTSSRSRSCRSRHRRSRVAHMPYKIQGIGRVSSPPSTTPRWSIRSGASRSTMR